MPKKKVPRLRFLFLFAKSYPPRMFIVCNSPAKRLNCYYSLKKGAVYTAPYVFNIRNPISFYKEMITFDFKLSSNSASSQDTLKIKFTSNFSPRASKRVTTSVIEAPSNLEILRKLSKYICSKS